MKALFYTLNVLLFYCSFFFPPSLMLWFSFLIQTLEYVCEEYGGRVQLAKAYYNGLTQSLKKNFGGNGLIASMEQCNDFFFLATKQISMGRVGNSLSHFQLLS